MFPIQKTFLDQSEICYAYYKLSKKNNNNQLSIFDWMDMHACNKGYAYPDLGAKVNDITYLIAIKSENHGSLSSVNDQEYEQKIKSLRKEFLDNSKAIPGYIFAIIVVKNEKYQIYKFKNGIVLINQIAKWHEIIDPLFE